MTSLQCVSIFIKYSLITACLASVNEVISDIAVDIVSKIYRILCFCFYNEVEIRCFYVDGTFSRIHVMYIKITFYPR